MNRDENYIGDVIFGLHAYANMPESFELPWDSTFVDIHDSAVYVVCCFNEPLGIRRYEGYLVNPQWKRLEAVNQAFVVPGTILLSTDEKTKETLLGTLDFSVAMMGASLFQSEHATIKPGGCWVGVTPFRGTQRLDATTGSRAYINLVDIIRGSIDHGIISVVDSGIDSEACGDALERTPSANESADFWRARGLKPAGGYSVGPLLGHVG